MGPAPVPYDAVMGTNTDRPTDRIDRARSDRRRDEAGTGLDDAGSRRDAEAAYRSFETAERDARAGRVTGGEPVEKDWNAVGLVTSLGATCLLGVSGFLARSTPLATVASVTFVAVGVLLARRGQRWCGTTGNQG